MKLLPSLLVAGLSIPLVGCVDSQEQLQKSKANLSVPETIGQTETGQSVKRYHVFDPGGHDNYIYVIDNKVVSTSAMRQEGKVQVPENYSVIVEDPIIKSLSAEDKKFIEDTLYQIKSCESVAKTYSMAISNVLNKYR
jgi:hypothetical protein